jgi:hypothetical protein
VNGPQFIPPPIRTSFEQAELPPGATKNDATTVFILGLLGILLCQILAPIAWAKGNTYRQVCMIHGVEPDGLGVAGRILGIVGTALLALSLLWVLFVVGISFAGR